MQENHIHLLLGRWKLAIWVHQSPKWPRLVSLVCPQPPWSGFAVSRMVKSSPNSLPHLPLVLLKMEIGNAEAPRKNVGKFGENLINFTGKSLHFIHWKPRLLFNIKKESLNSTKGSESLPSPSRLRNDKNRIFLGCELNFVCIKHCYLEVNDL